VHAFHLHQIGAGVARLRPRRGYNPSLVVRVVERQAIEAVAWVKVE
jgi:hypothetical protein